MIKRPTILKLLKQAGKYEKRFFTLKKAELEEIATNFGIDLTQPPDEQVKVETKVKAKVKSKAKPKKVEIAEFSDTEGESEEEEVPEKKPKKPKMTRKHITHENTEKEYTPRQRDIEKDRINTINVLIKEFGANVRNLLYDFDDVQDLDKHDEIYIIDEFNKLYDEVIDKLDTIVSQSEMSDKQVRKFESKIEMHTKKVEKFLE